jgi:hypothetical protein
MSTTKTKSGDSGNKRTLPNEASYNGWMCARDIAAGVFSLINNGKIYPAFCLLILMLMGMVLWRVPESELGSIITLFLKSVVGTAGIAWIFFFSSNFGWSWLLIRQRRLYQNEIDRLSHIRKELLHGRAIIERPGELDKPIISKHRSSDGEQTEGYILPDQPDHLI